MIAHWSGWHQRPDGAVVGIWMFSLWPRPLTMALSFCSRCPWFIPELIVGSKAHADTRFVFHA